MPDDAPSCPRCDVEMKPREHDGPRAWFVCGKCGRWESRLNTPPPDPQGGLF